MILIYRPPTTERVDCDFNNIALKLHKQITHPSADRLKSYLRDSGITDKKLMKCVDIITESCHTCLRYRKPHPKPVVSMLMAYAFNENVRMNLKVMDGVYLLVFFCLLGFV